jgi:hypothetical protein
MKLFIKILKWTGISLLLLIIGLVVLVASRQNLTFEAPYPNIHASRDSTVIARGKYLVRGPAHCVECHHTPNSTQTMGENGESIPSGGYVFELPIGKIYVPNITPDPETGIGRLTDGEIARTLRYGVGYDGRAMIDFMPFHNMSDEDLTAVVSYLRVIPPVKNLVPSMDLNALGNVVKAFMIKPVGPEGEVAKKVAQGVNAEYGEYLANSIANCKGCHTNRDMKTGATIGEDYAGGFKMEALGKPDMNCVSRNLTPDPETGHIYKWNMEQFVDRFKRGKIIQESPMPWDEFRNMSEEDLQAIYLYLKTLKPIKSDPGPTLIQASM